jgi:hypothetical protein
MDWLPVVEVVSIITTIGLTLMGWWVNAQAKSQEKISDDLKCVANDLKRLEVKLPTEYARKEDINNRLDKIDSTLERLFDKLDEKADRA